MQHRGSFSLFSQTLMLACVGTNLVDSVNTNQRKPGISCEGVGKTTIASAAACRADPTALARTSDAMGYSSANWQGTRLVSVRPPACHIASGGISYKRQVLHSSQLQRQRRSRPFGLLRLCQALRAAWTGRLLNSSGDAPLHP